MTGVGLASMGSLSLQVGDKRLAAAVEGTYGEQGAWTWSGKIRKVILATPVRLSYYLSRLLLPFAAPKICLDRRKRIGSNPKKIELVSVRRP
jgi:hypothetical protein